MSKRTLLIMAGGTGGHIFPALAVAKALKAKGWNVVWLGAAGAMETRLVPQHDIPLETLAIRGVRGNGLLRWLTLPVVQLRAVLKALRIIFEYRPDVAIGFGGFTGFPGGLAARLLWLPLVVHEQNSVAGLTNRVLSKIASRVLFAFPSAFPGRDGLVGNPVRPEIAAVAAPAERFAGRQGPLRLLVVGGSLGAQALNDTVPAALALLPEGERPLVTHQAGQKQLEALQQNYQRAGVAGEAVAFIDDMASAYGEADLVICRAGALTIAELAAAGVASVLVPYPHAVDDHQTGNARYLADAGAAILVPQNQLSAEGLAELLKNMNREQLLAMATSARQLALPAATDSVVRVCEELAG